MAWVPVARTEEIPVGRVQVAEVNGRRIAVCHAEDGFYAIDDLCTHDGGPLDQGELFDHQIECPRHGARFDIRTGRVLRLPAVRPIRTYPVRLNGDTIEVDVEVSPG